MKNKLKPLLNILSLGIVISFLIGLFISRDYILSSRYLYYKMYRLIAWSFQESLNNTVLPSALWITCLYISLCVSLFLIKRSFFSSLSFTLKVDIKDRDRLIRISFATAFSLIFLVYDGWLMNKWFIVNKNLATKIFANMIHLPLTASIWMLLIQGRWEKFWGLMIKVKGPCLKLLDIIAIILITFIILFNIYIYYIDKRINIPEGPNVIIIAVDSLRADHLGCFGYNRNTSPSIDKLAKDGILFMNAISLSSSTFPSMSGFFTSQYPDVLNAKSWFNKIEDRFLFLSEIFKNYNYTTCGFVANSFYSSRLKVDQGFDFFDDDIVNCFDDTKPEEYLQSSVSSDDVTEKAIKFLRDNKANKFFLFLFYYDPHYDYFLHKDYNYYTEYNGMLRSNEPFQPILENSDIRLELTKEDLKFFEACYDSEINFTDKYIGIFLNELKRLNLYDNTIILFLSDHGTEFMERGQLGHGHSLHQELIHIPLIIKLPRQKNKNHVVTSFISIIDVMPSLLDYLKVRNLVGLDLEGRAINLDNLNNINRTVIFSEFPEKCVIMDNKKLIFDKKSDSLSFYDLDKDPFEKEDLLKEIPGEINKFKQVLDDWLKYIKEKKLSIGDRVEPIEYTEGQKEQLRSLGYI